MKQSKKKQKNKKEDFSECCWQYDLHLRVNKQNIRESRSVERKKALEKKDEFHCFCCCHPIISQGMMNHFWKNQFINSVCKVFHLSQFLSIPANECRRTFKIKKTKMNGYNS